MKSPNYHNLAYWEVEVEYGTWEESEDILLDVVRRIYEGVPKTPKNRGLQTPTIQDLKKPK